MTMYTDVIISKDEALCHLFLHCCCKDGTFNERELDFVSGLFVELGLHQTLNFKEELSKYWTYSKDIMDEDAFLEYLINLIHPVNEYALYSYCVELELSDASLDMREEKLLNKIADILQIDATAQDFSKKIMIQRRAVEDGKIF